MLPLLLRESFMGEEEAIIAEGLVLTVLVDQVWRKRARAVAFSWRTVVTTS